MVLINLIFSEFVSTYEIDGIAPHFLLRIHSPGHPRQEVARWVYPNTPHLTPQILPPYWAILSFSRFLVRSSYKAIWRHFRAPFSSNFIWLESSGCLVPNGPSLARIWAMLIEIWHLEEDDAVLKNSVMFFFENFVSSNLG